MSNSPLAEPLSLTRRRIEEAIGFIAAAGAVGLWVRSDGDGDDRERRQLLREADWAASGAHRALKSIEIDPSELSARITEARAALAAAIERLEQVPTFGSVVVADFDVSGFLAHALSRLEPAGEAHVPPA